jgi:hypothetical protein
MLPSLTVIEEGAVMIYLQELSILYDSIMYGMLLFNEKYIKKNFVFLGNEKFSLFHKYKEQSNFSIDNLVKQFFYYDFQKGYTMLAQFLLDNLNTDNMYNYNLDCFINDIHSKQFYHHALIYFMKDDCVDNYKIEEKYKSIGIILNRLEEIEYPDNFKLRIGHMFEDFNIVINILIITLSKIYKIVKTVHQKNKSVINNFIFESKKPEVINLINTLSFLSIEEYDTRPIIFTLFVEYVCTRTEAIDIFGKEFQEVLKNRNEYGNITRHSYAKIIGNICITELIDIFGNGGDEFELNATDSSRLLNITIAAASNYLKIMLNEKVICVSRKTSISTYYKRNKIYFEKAIEMQIRLLDNWKK